MNYLSTLFHDRKGDLAQYALILLLVVVVTTTVLTNLGIDITSAINNFDNQAFAASTGSSGNSDSGGIEPGTHPKPGPGPIPGPGPNPTQ